MHNILDSVASGAGVFLWHENKKWCIFKFGKHYGGVGGKHYEGIGFSTMMRDGERVDHVQEQYASNSQILCTNNKGCHYPLYARLVRLLEESGRYC